MEARGKSSAMSAANAISNHLRDWLSYPSASSGTPGGIGGGKRSDDSDGSERSGGRHATGQDEERQKLARCVSMGVSTDGNTYGVPGGLFFSFPVECSAGEVDCAGTEVGPLHVGLFGCCVRRISGFSGMVHCSRTTVVFVTGRE